MISGAVATANALNSCVERIKELQEIVEKQEECIAVLWVNVYGYNAGEGGFVGDKYVSSSTEELHKAWGVCPLWHVDVDRVLSEYSHLTRKSDYSWGSPKSLYEK